MVARVESCAMDAISSQRNAAILPHFDLHDVDLDVAGEATRRGAARRSRAVRRPPAAPAAAGRRPRATAGGPPAADCGPGTGRAGRWRRRCPAPRRRSRRRRGCPPRDDPRQRLRLGPKTVPPRWFSKPVSRWVSPSQQRLATTSPIVRAGCGDVVTSSSPTPSTRSPDDVSYQCPSTWIAAQIASTGAPRRGRLLQAGIADQVPGGEPLRVVLGAAERVQVQRSRHRVGQRDLDDLGVDTAQRNRCRSTTALPPSP